MELDKTESDVLSKNIEVSAHTVKKKKKGNQVYYLFCRFTGIDAWLRQAALNEYFPITEYFLQGTVREV